MALQKQFPLAILLVVFILVVFVSFVPVASFAQEEIPDDLTITVGQLDASDYPNITAYVTVTDVGGNYVAGLVEEDFHITEDGEAVEMVDFAGIGDPRPVDIVYVFDTTGSMRQEIDGVIRTCIAFADELASKGRDSHLGLVTFADRVLQVKQSDGSLTGDAEEFKDWVSQLDAEGGNADPENDYGAIKRALKMKFRDDSQIIFILITDAPPHHYGDYPDGGQRFDDPDLTEARMLTMLSQENVSLYAVTPSYREFVNLTTETGGSFYDIERNPDFTGIIGDIGEAIASQYRITYTSPRPTYDGTRREIIVTVSGQSGSGEYVEKHLLNIVSDPLVGALFLLPLLVVWLVPASVQAFMRRRDNPSQPAVSYPPQSVMHPPKVAQPPQESVSSRCAHCGYFLRTGARFCANCGGEPQDAVPPPSAVSTASASFCRHCGNALRSGVKFCDKCGKPIG